MRDKGLRKPKPIRDRWSQLGTTFKSVYSCPSGGSQHPLGCFCTLMEKLIFWNWVQLPHLVTHPRFQTAKSSISSSLKRMPCAFELSFLTGHCKSDLRVISLPSWTTSKSQLYDGRNTCITGCSKMANSCLRGVLISNFLKGATCRNELARLNF